MYAAVCLDSDVSWVCCLVYTMVILGTDEVAHKLADPFGNDASDLPTFHYWVNTWISLQTLLDENASLPTGTIDKVRPEPLSRNL